MPSTSEERWEGGEILPPSPSSPSKWLFRPGSMGFVVLALSIFLSGFAHKLSLYYVHQNSSSRVLVAKLWIETRNARVVTDLLRKVTIERPPIAANLSVAQNQTLLADLGTVAHAPKRFPSLDSFISLIPSRSPPSRRFCLA
jgi:hypothetical protein